MANANQETIEFSGDAGFSEKFFAAAATPLKMRFGAATHTGHVRASNEDHFAIVRRTRTSELILASLPPAELALERDHDFAMIVADGMGGERFGEFASRMALRKMFELANRATSWVMRITDAETQQVRQRVEAYVQQIQRALREYTRKHPVTAGMGTTWTSVHLMPPHALLVHLGDSRAYLMHDGELRQLTRDETMAQAFIDAGMDPASVSRFRHVLINSFGGDNDDVTAQTRQLLFGAGDQLLLCTDGLTDMVDEATIAQQLKLSRSPQEACDALVACALANGGKDNVTVALASAEAASGSALAS
ncbi:MAG: protein phosphatase 2C domain-containing protein [Planctomycetota bacterium]